MITLKIQLFGGRGASLGIKSQIPSPDKASIHDDKIYKYYLNEEKEHYHEFVEAGYTKENGEQLRRDMLDGLKNNPVHEYIRTDTGYQKAIVYMELGINKKKLFKTVWGKSKDERYYRNVTAYRFSSVRKK